MIKFKTLAPPPYEITSRELAVLLNKTHNLILNKLYITYRDVTEIDFKETIYKDQGNRDRKEYYLSMNFAVKIILSYNYDFDFKYILHTIFLEEGEDPKKKNQVIVKKRTPAIPSLKQRLKEFR